MTTHRTLYYWNHTEFWLVAKKDRQKDFCGTDPLATLGVDIYDEQILSLIDYLFEIPASHDPQETNFPTTRFVCDMDHPVELRMLQ